MANPYHHAVSSTKKWGGEVTDYLAIHEWFDASKQLLGDFRHRALRHHTEGIFLAMELFGDHEHCITTSAGRKIPVRWVGEQHVTEDLGFIPTVADWLRGIQPEPWMSRSRKLSISLESTPALEPA